MNLFRLVEDISHETVGTVLLRRNITMNIQLKRDEIQVQVRGVDVLLVLPALADWAANCKGFAIGSTALVPPTLIKAHVSGLQFQQWK
jgi:hypothetical protein